LFTQCCVHDATAPSFPLSKLTGGGDTVPAFSGWRVYLQLMWEVGLPPSPVEFSSHHCFYKLSRSSLLGVCHCSCLLWPSLFIYSSVRDSPPPPSVLRAPHPICYVSLLLLLLITQVIFFCRGGGGLSRELCWSGPGLSVGVLRTACSPCPHLPKPSVRGSLMARWPSWFLFLLLT
jgi:hypothetical protein